jgi:hypothetical protein
MNMVKVTTDPPPSGNESHILHPDKKENMKGLNDK